MHSVNEARSHHWERQVIVRPDVSIQTRLLAEVHIVNEDLLVENEETELAVLEIWHAKQCSVVVLDDLGCLYVLSLQLDFLLFFERG